VCASHLARCTVDPLPATSRGETAAASSTVKCLSCLPHAWSVRVRDRSGLRPCHRRGTKKSPSQKVLHRQRSAKGLPWCRTASGCAEHHHQRGRAAQSVPRRIRGPEAEPSGHHLAPAGVPLGCPAGSGASPRRSQTCSAPDYRLRRQPANLTRQFPVSPVSAPPPCGGACCANLNTSTSCHIAQVL